MSRGWVPSGGKDYVHVSLEPEIQEHIRTHLALRGMEPPTEFFDGLNEAVTRCVIMRGIAEQSRPARVKKNLRKAFDLAQRLDDALTDLDDNAKHLIREGGGVGVAELQRHSSAIIMAVVRAQGLADEYPGGRLPESGNVLLALNIKDVMENILGLPGTTTKEGDWESLVVLVLNSGYLDGRKIWSRNSANSLIRRALEVERCGGFQGQVDCAPPPDPER